MKLVGKIMLLVTGILFLAVAIWTAVHGIRGLVDFFASIKLENIGEKVADIVKNVGWFVVSVIVTILFYLFAGIRGIKSFTKGDSKNITKAFIWAIIILVLNVGTLIGTGFSAVLTTGLAVDAVYVVGAFFVKLSK